MKKTLAALAVLTGIMTASGGTVAASDVVLPAQQVKNGVVVQSTNYDLDLNQYKADQVSVQVSYSSAAPTAITFGDGTPGTGTITVTANTGLATSYAVLNITVSSNTVLSNSWLNINNVLLREGQDWTKGSTSSSTAISLCQRLQKRFSGVFVSTVVVGQTVIYSTASVAGSAANAYGCASSTPAALVCSAATFTGGVDNAYIKINNVPFRVNTEFQVGADTTGTARNISAAINASSLKNVLVATHTANVVVATASVTGRRTNYAMTTSTSAALTLSGSTFSNGTDADITLSASTNVLNNFFSYSMIFPGSAYGPTNTINKTPTGLYTGSQLLLTKTAGNYPGPLQNNVTYYATNLTASSFQLSDTSTGATAGLALSITTSTIAGGGSFTLTPATIAGSVINGTASFKLQKSNDGTNFQDIWVSTQPTLTPVQASVSFGSPYTAGSIVWDLGDVLYRYLRLAYTGATWGGVNLSYVVNGKKK